MDTITKSKPILLKLLLPFLLTLWSIQTIPPTLASSSGLGRNYKESCSESEPCNPIKYLECRHRVCECIAPNEIIYDRRSSGCAALAGHSCLRQIPGEQTKQKRHRPKPQPLTTTTTPESEDNLENNDISLAKYQIACVPHAKCSYPEDICECEFRFYKAPNSTCLPQKGYGDRCNSDDQCDKYRFLSCISNTCTCDKNHRYDPKQSKCMVTIGSNCKIINYLSISEELFMDDECPEDASCVQRNPEEDRGVCKCNPGFKLNSDKTCGRDYGDKCSGDKKCSDIQFICRSGICQCKYPLHQYFDGERKSCISLSGGPCDAIPAKNANNASGDDVGDPLTCTENSVCQESNPYNFCKCLSGYVENNEGHCVKAYGTECNLDEECDPLPPLACINNACSCPDKLQVYEDKHRACVSLAGGRCRKEVNGTVPSCVPNAYCVRPNGYLDFGRCLCSRGTHTTGGRVCSKGQ